MTYRVNDFIYLKDDDERLIWWELDELMPLIHGIIWELRWREYKEGLYE